MYPSGIDCVWIGVDKNKNLAVFITAGCAPIPNALIESKVNFEEIEIKIQSMPKNTESQLLIEVPCPDSFLAFADRGFFVYDWTDIGKIDAEQTNEYQMVAKPKAPCTIDQIPDYLAALASLINFPLQFSNSFSINLQKYYPSVAEQTM